MEEVNIKPNLLGFLIYAQGSCDETVCHLSKLSILYPELHLELENKAQQNQFIGGKINNFIKYVQSNWRTSKDNE